MYDMLRLVTLLLVICSPIHANISPNEHLKLTSSSQNLTSFDVQLTKWSQSTEEEIRVVESLMDEIIVDLIDFLPDLITEKSRVKRDTFDNAFGAPTTCQISEEELNSLKSILLNVHSRNSQISSETISRNTDNCTRLFLEIKNLIINLINTFINLKNVQITSINFEIMKQNYEDKINEIERKFDNFEKRSSQQFKTKINQFIATMHSFKQQSEVLIKNLRNERIAHRNTNIRLCILELKTNDQDFSACARVFGNGESNMTFINHIISTAYENNKERILPILKLSHDNSLHHETVICISEALINEIYRNGHQNSPQLLLIHYQIDQQLQMSTLIQNSPDLKSRFINAKIKTEVILDIWANEIRSQDCNSIIKFERKYFKEFFTVCELLTEKTYLNNLNNVNKFISYLRRWHYFEIATKMTNRLLDLMISNHHRVSRQGVNLYYYITSKAGSRDFITAPDVLKQKWYNMKKRLITLRS